MIDNNTWEKLLYKLKGIDRDIKRAYQSIFNSSDNSRRKIAKKVIDDLIIRFKYYGAPITTDPIQLAKQAAHREVIEYILTMSAKISEDTLTEIEKFINK